MQQNTDTTRSQAVAIDAVHEDWTCSCRPSPRSVVLMPAASKSRHSNTCCLRLDDRRVHMDTRRAALLAAIAIQRPAPRHVQPRLHLAGRARRPRVNNFAVARSPDRADRLRTLERYGLVPA